MTSVPDHTTPVFVRGLSRSGGTLLVTLLDAHSGIAMSYELYPTLLSRDEISISLEWFAKHLENAKSLEAAARSIEAPNLRTFVARCARGGLDQHDLARLVRDHARAGQGLADPSGQLHFIERCGQAKMLKAGKQTWGMKCNSDFETYLSKWPKAFFINIVRDGRDVLASQLNTGSFTNTPADVARSWVNTHRKFQTLLGDPCVRAHEVVYERLAYNPEDEVRRLCDFLCLPYDESMLHFYDKELTIYGTRHLSMDRISSPIDTQRIGRWQSDLGEEHLRDFYEVAGDLLVSYGYAREADIASLREWG